MENSLLEAGVAGGELEDIKKNALKVLGGRREQEPVEQKAEEEEEI